MCMMFLQFNTCSMVLHLTIQYQGDRVCMAMHIEGHAYSFFFLGSLNGLMTIPCIHNTVFLLIKHPCISTLTVVNVSRNGRGALYKPLKLLTLKT